MKLTIACHCGEVRTKLSDMQNRLSGGLADLHEALGLKLLSLARMNMERETTPDGTPWKQLAPATIKLRRGSAHPILRRSGDLYRSITVRADAQKAVVGTNWRYARIHQMGGMAGRGRNVRIPARPYLFSPGGSIPQRWHASLENLVKTYLDTAHA